MIIKNMTIEGIELTEVHIGDPVTYIPRHANGNASHKNCERGTIKRWNDTFVFVQYVGNVKATPPELLVFG